MGEDVEICEKEAAEKRAWDLKYSKTASAGTGGGKIVLL